MSKFQQQLPPGADGLIRRLEDLEREVRALRAGRRLESSTIGRGGVTIKGGAIILQDSEGREIARMGAREDLTGEPSGGPQPGFILRRNDGSIAFTLDDPNPIENGYQQYLKMQDASGTIIFKEDHISKFGLSSPTFPTVFYPGVETSWPSTNQAAPGWAELWLAGMPVWNPQIVVSCFAWGNSAGTARLLVNGVAVGGTRPIVPATTQITWQVDLTGIAGSAGQAVTLSLQANRTNAVATERVYMAPIYALGTPTP